jgi:hypothetical protein
MKFFHQIDNVGKAKYTVNFHDGKKKHKDGSDFYDIKIFKDRSKLTAFINELKTQGYVLTWQLTF